MVGLVWWALLKRAIETVQREIGGRALVATIAEPIKEGGGVVEDEPNLSHTKR